MQRVIFPGLLAIVTSLCLFSTSAASSSRDFRDCEECQKNRHPDTQETRMGCSKPSLEGNVFVMTNENSARGNEVVMYNRYSNGKLTKIRSFATGGRGSGPAPSATAFAPEIPTLSAPADGLGSQESLAINRSKSCLVGVNADSNNVFSFKVVKGKELEKRPLIEVGSFPVSVTLSEEDLDGRTIGFVLGFGEINRFEMNSDCMMVKDETGTISLDIYTDIYPTPKPGEVLTAPAMITFSPDGQKLLASIKGGRSSDFSGKILVFNLDRDLTVHGQPRITYFGSDNNKGPFSMAFTRNNQLVVTHVNSNTIGVYNINENKDLNIIKESKATQTSLPCWIKNTSSGFIVSSFGDVKGVASAKKDSTGIFTVFDVNEDGVIEKFKSDAYKFPEWRGGGTAHAIDFAIVESDKKQFMYAIDPRFGDIKVVEIIDSNHSTMKLNWLETVNVEREGVNPDKANIENFKARCSDYPIDSDIPEQCNASSLQGIVGF